MYMNFLRNELKRKCPYSCVCQGDEFWLVDCSSYCFSCAEQWGKKSLLSPSQLTRNTFTPRAEVTKVPYVLIMCFCTVLDQDLAGLLWCVSHHLVLEHWGQSHVPSSCTNKQVSGCTQNEELNVT